MSYDLTGQKVSFTYGRVVQVVSGSYYDGFGNPLNIATGSIIIDTSSFATTSSNIFLGDQIVNGNLVVTNGITGSLQGTASYSENSNSSSYALSASYAVTASYAQNAANAINSQNAQDILVYVKNASGTTIAKGQLVRILGVDNSSNNPTIELADYRYEGISANTIGYAYQDFSINAFGYVITEGRLVGVDTSNFNSGDLLYLSSSGTYTNIEPIAPNHTVRIGQVIRSQSQNGSIYVSIDNGSELGEAHDVIDNSTTASYGDLLIKSGSVWINSKNLTGSYFLSGSLTTNDGLSVFSLTASNISASSITANVQGTSSWSNNSLSSSVSQTASFLPVAVYQITSSWAQTASFARTSSIAQTASFLPAGTYNITSSWATNALTASLVLTSIVSSSLAETASSLVITNSYQVNRISISNTASADNDAITRDYVTSRGINLITNGYGSLLNNYNFSGFSFDGADTYAGGGSFTTVGGTFATLTTEYIPVEEQKAYYLEFYGKSGNQDGTEYNAAARTFIGIDCYDIDKLSISPEYVSNGGVGPDTYLDQALNPGDTQMIVSGSVASWLTGSSAASARNIAWWPYTSSLGYSYEPFTYTRKISSLSNTYTGMIAASASFYSTNGLWATTGITASTSQSLINLTRPWGGPLLPSGSPVRNYRPGGTFIYPFSPSDNIIPSGSWRKFTGYLGNIGTTTLNALRPATSFVRYFLGVNYNVASGSNRTRLSAISMYEFPSLSSSVVQFGGNSVSSDTNFATIGSRNNAPFYLISSGSIRATIGAGGQIGIGTTSAASSKLTVYDSPASMRGSSSLTITTDILQDQSGLQAAAVNNGFNNRYNILSFSTTASNYNAMYNQMYFSNVVSGSYLGQYTAFYNDVFLQMRTSSMGANSTITNISCVNRFLQQSTSSLRDVILGTNTTAFEQGQNTNTASITNLYHHRLTTPFNGTTNTSSFSITNAYGIYIFSQKSATVTNSYAIFQQGANDANQFAGYSTFGTTTLQNVNRLACNSGVAIGSTYFSTAAPTNGMIIQGNVGISTTSPTNTLHVAGTIRCTGLITASGGISASAPITASSFLGPLTGSVFGTSSLALTASYAILTTVSSSLNFADDTAAAAGGVPLGGLYRNGNTILIRIT